MARVVDAHPACALSLGTEPRCEPVPKLPATEDTEQGLRDRRWPHPEDVERARRIQPRSTGRREGCSIDGVAAVRDALATHRRSAQASSRPA
jgi:hypothetical protein